MSDVQVPGWVSGKWRIDPAHSHVGFVIKHMVVSKVRGHFQTYDGTITTTPDPLGSSVEVQIDATSIFTGNETRDEHVRSVDFFDVENRPTFTFVSTGMRIVNDEWLLDGELTIRGITKSVTLGMETPEFGPGVEEGTHKMGATASTEIRRSDFGISYNGPIPGGGKALGENVEIILEVEADLIA